MPMSAPATTTMSSWGMKCCGTNDRGPTVELVLDRVRSDRRVVVLPEAEYAPALADEDGLILRISLAVGEQLAPPELRVRLREVGVQPSPSQTKVTSNRGIARREDILVVRRAVGATELAARAAGRR
ncbi:hypothetical protein [Curtobacterium flaccumfaciens]|uniref:hypothetical protein n=1 Tax=Curtobacterium flaccumfaciens TaxID=2035 RepID=UPI002202EED5|nr:hypothetical protein [Curtobacterium flaccumfaciens]UWD80484.1 hypothetical protein NY058_06815 [Curtobacterium flaccumfaciens]